MMTTTTISFQEEAFQGMLVSKLREDSLTKLEVSPMIFQNGRLDSDTIRDLLSQTPNPNVKTLELIGLPIDRSIAAAVLNLLRSRDWERVSLVGCTGRDLFTLFFDSHESIPSI
jgi:hypothetical protein